MSPDFCIPFQLPPQLGFPGAGAALANWGSSPMAAHPRPQVCSTSDGPQGQSWHAAYCILNNQKEAKAKMFPMWRCGEGKREDRGCWLLGQSTGLHVKGDPDDSLDKALTCVRFTS